MMDLSNDKLLVSKTTSQVKAKHNDATSLELLPVSQERPGRGLQRRHLRVLGHGFVLDLPRRLPELRGRRGPEATEPDLPDELTPALLVKVSLL